MQVAKPRRRSDSALLMVDSDLVKGVSIVLPATQVFSHSSELLAIIKESMINKVQYIDLGLFCCDVCQVLYRGLNGRRLHELSRSVRDAMNQLTTAVSEIQRKVMRAARRSPVLRILHAESDKKTIATWNLSLTRILHVFNTELALNTHVIVMDIHTGFRATHTMIEGVRTIVEKMHREVVRDPGQTTTTERRALLVGGPEQATSLLRVENNQCPVDGGENTHIKADGIEYLEEDQTSESTKAVVDQPVAKLTHATTPGPVTADGPERRNPHTESRGSKIVDSGLTAVTTSLPMLQIVEESLRNEDAVLTILPPSPCLRDRASSDPTLPQHVKVGFHPPTTPGVVISGWQPATAQDGICNNRGSKHTLVYPGERPQSCGIIDQNTDRSSPQPAPCYRVDTHDGRLPCIVDPTPGFSTIVDHSMPAYKRLISNAFSPHELIALIGATFTSKDEVRMVCNLHGDDAQTFIDVIHEALDLPDLPLRLRSKCLSALCRICGSQALLPRSLQIPSCYSRSDNPLYKGGFADVWKGKHKGLCVAIKALRIYSKSDFSKIASRFCKEVVTWNTLRHPNVLPLLGVSMGDNQLAMVSEWMDHGNINEFVKTHWDANRFELLKDVARGLMYMHGQGMIHGDLKGANILVDQSGHARLTDFGLLTIVSDPTNFTPSSSTSPGGTIRWMSPELLFPDQFGPGDSRPTVESDCYALGMVIYEVLSGQAPFTPFKEAVVVQKVIGGEQPERPGGVAGALFADDLWELLVLCWTTESKSRPSIEVVFATLDQVSETWEPPPAPQVDEGIEEAESDFDLTILSKF